MSCGRPKRRRSPITTFPKHPDKRLTDTIKNHAKRVTVTEQRLNAVQSKAANTAANVATLTTNVTTLTGDLTPAAFTAMDLNPDDWATDAGHPVPSYRLVPGGGSVEICGFAFYDGSLTSTLNILTSDLPSGYRPSTEILVVPPSPVSAGIEVTTDGQVNAIGYTGGSTQINFSGTYPLGL